MAENETTGTETEAPPKQTVKLVVPEDDMCSVKVGDEQYAVENGLVTVLADHAAALTAVGFTHYEEPDEGHEQNPGGEGNGGASHELSRKELFDKLKKMGVRVSHTLKTDRLREILAAEQAKASSPS